MADVLVLGGGFGGVVAAESLAKRLSDDHQITLVSRNDRFVFHPALVRLAFGKAEPDDISYDLRDAMTERRIRFVEAEVARVDPHARRVVLSHGDIDGSMSYDYLIFALGRRLATEQVAGFYEHANHLLTVEAALKFGEAIRDFHEGRAVIGYCPDARLAVPVYETAFELARVLEERGEREKVAITLVSPETPSGKLGGDEMADALRASLERDGIEFLPNFPISRVTENAVSTPNGHSLNYDLLMLIPPFEGPSAVSGMGITDREGYIRVDRTMRVRDIDGMYAVGDCVAFLGPKMGHMAVQQAEVAAQNVAAEIEGKQPAAKYNHELMLVIDQGGSDAIYLHKTLWDDSKTKVRQGRFWSWAKWLHEKYWAMQHS